MTYDKPPIHVRPILQGDPDRLRYTATPTSPEVAILSGFVDFRGGTSEERATLREIGQLIISNNQEDAAQPQGEGV